MSKPGPNMPQIIPGPLALWLPWQIKFRDLDKNNMFGRGLLKEHFFNTFVKISAVR